MDKQAYDEPSDVSAEDGDVIVDGPDGVAVTLTPEAAIETSDRLLDKATVATGQRHFAGEKALTDEREDQEAEKG